MKHILGISPILWLSLLLVLGVLGWSMLASKNQAGLLNSSTTQASNMKAVSVPELGLRFSYPSRWSSFSFKRTDYDPINTQKVFTYSYTSGTDIRIDAESGLVAFQSPEKPVNTDWSLADFQNAVGNDEHLPILLVKKLSSKSLFVIGYSRSCSPESVWMTVFAPVNTLVPNLRITIPTPTPTPSEQTILNTYDARKISKDGLACEGPLLYKQIVDGWSKDGFPKQLTDELSTAQAIADSVENIQPK